MVLSVGSDDCAEATSFPTPSADPATGIDPVAKTCRHETSISRFSSPVISLLDDPGASRFGGSTGMYTIILLTNSK